MRAARNFQRMRAALLFLVLLLSAWAGAQVAFDTARFDVALTIEPDRTLSIVENITVDFREQRRGILRTLPTVVRGESAERTIRYGGYSATANGSPVPVKDSNDSDLVTLRIGDPNVRVLGKVVYELSYKAYGALTNIEGKDEIGPRVELMWNAVPSDWPTAIGSSQIVIRYPQPKTDSFGVRALYGPRGSRAGTELFWGKKVIGRTDLLSVGFGDPTLIQVIAQKPLEKGYGITVVVALPQGTVSEESDADIRPFEVPGVTNNELPSNPIGVLFPLATVLIGLPYALSRRFKKPGPLVVRFDPPEGVDPMRAGVLFDDNFQPRDLLAGMISLAQKGAGKFHVADGQMILTLNGKEPPALSSLEQQLLGSLKSYGPEVTPDALKGVFSASYNALEAQAKADLVHDGWRRKKGNPAWLGCGLFFLLSVVAFVGFFFAGFWSCLGFILACGILVWITLLPTVWTPIGVRKKWELEGLREFIVRAHKDPLEFAAKQHPDAAMYERILPYAISFGLVQQWSKAFEGVQLSQPDWFDGGYDPYHPWYWCFSDGYGGVSHDWGQASHTPSSSGWSSGDSGFGGGFSDSGGFDGGGGFDSGGSVGDGGGGGGGGDW